MNDKPTCNLLQPRFAALSNCSKQACSFKTVRSTGVLGVNPNDMPTINVKLCLNKCML